MGKSLVIAEKPSVAKEIAKALGANQKSKDRIENNKYIITWAFGHLLSLADPEYYNKKFANWQLEDLPIIPNNFKLSLLKGAGSQFHAIKKMINSNAVKEIIIATDAGREGELVARWILLFAGNKKPLKRLWISSVTKKAIINGFQNLKAGKEYNNLFLAAEARAESDWIVGINATRALTTKFGTPLSCGRVQTPTIAMVKSREQKIKNFKAKKYYGLTLSVFGETFIWQNRNGQSSSFDKGVIEKILAKIKNAECKLIAVEKKEKKQYPDKLYDLTSLQKEAYQRYQYSLKQTLNYMQSLYEEHKALTYPRTDARYLTTDMKSTINERLAAIRDYDSKPFAQELLRSNARLGKHIFNDAEVSDHHAIIPTEEAINSNDLSRQEWTVYEMVVKRFLANLMPAHVYDQEIVTAEIAGEKFVLKRNFSKSLGYLALSQQQAEQSDAKLKKGMTTKDFKLAITEAQTKPPAYFNEGTLLAAMENPSSYTDDQKYSKVLKQTGGIGTVATRAEIIDKLFYNGLLIKSGNAIQVSSKGQQLLEVAPEDLKSPELTAQWELKLAQIEKGSLNKNKFLDEIKGFTTEIIKDIKASEAKFRYDNKLNKPCPECGGTLVLQSGRNGKSEVCVNYNCKYRMTVERQINARCPECKKKLTLRKTSNTKIYTCSCGFKEGQEAFDKRMQANKKRGGKRDFINYQKQQAKAEKEKALANNPFAKALSDLKLDK